MRLRRSELPALPSYDGSSPVDSLIQLYRERAMEFGHSGLQLKFLFTQHLKGKALEFYMNMPDRAELSFNQLMRRFKEHFMERPQTAVSSMMELQTCRQKGAETLQEFGQRLLKLARLAAPGGDP